MSEPSFWRALPRSGSMSACAPNSDNSLHISLVLLMNFSISYSWCEYVSLACHWVDPVSIAKAGVLVLVSNMCSGRRIPSMLFVLLFLVLLRFALSKLR